MVLVKINCQSYIIICIICDSTYRKVPVVGRRDFELWGCKVKISQHYIPKVDFEISHSLESSILNL